MNPEYTIVKATKSHLAAIPAIEQAAAAIFAEEDLPGAIRYLVTDNETLSEAQQDGRIWMALDSRCEPVGFAMITFLDGNAHVDEMDVLPAHSRKGIGTRLMASMVEWARSKRHSVLTLVTFRHLAWNAPFYFRLGFEAIETDAIGPEMREQLLEEKKAGINIENRQIMMLKLRDAGC